MSIISSIKHDAHTVTNAIDSHKTAAEIAGGAAGGVAAVAGGAKAVQKLVGPSVTAALSPEEIQAQQAIIRQNLARSGLAIGEEAAHEAPIAGEQAAHGVATAPKVG